MAPDDRPREPASGSGGKFPATRWSLVVAAGHTAHPDARGALATLCETYWEPLYAFLRRKGHGPDDAQDLVQGFFAHFLSANYLKVVRAERGRFRSYLLGALTHFLADERDRARALKRGGGKIHLSLEVDEAEQRYRLEPVEDLTPEKLYERRWALNLLERVMGRLRDDYEGSGKGAVFRGLKVFITGSGGPSYEDVARDLGMTEGAVKVAIHRLRRRYRDLLRNEVAQTVAAEDEVEREIRHLMEALGA